MILKVLSVDDSYTITTHLEYILKDVEDIEWVGHAYSLNEAEELIKKTTPHVILLDIMLNEENGFDLLESINNQNADIEVVLLSNLSDSIYVRKSKSMGATAFIDKSFEFHSIPVFLREIHKRKFLKN